MSKQTKTQIVIREKSGIGFFSLGILLGGLIGFIVALLNAPQSGRQTIEQITNAAEDAVDGVRERITGDNTDSIIAAGKQEARRVTNDFPVGNPRLN